MKHPKYSEEINSRDAERFEPAAPHRDRTQEQQDQLWAAAKARQEMRDKEWAEMILDLMKSESLNYSLFGGKR